MKKRLGCWSIFLGGLAVLVAIVFALQWFEKREYKALLEDPERNAMKLAKLVDGFGCPSLSVVKSEVDYLGGRHGGAVLQMTSECKADLREKLDASITFSQGDAKYGKDHCYTMQVAIEHIEMICFEKNGVYFGAQRAG